MVGGVLLQTREWSNFMTAVLQIEDYDRRQEYYRCRAVWSEIYLSIVQLVGSWENQREPEDRSISENDENDSDFPAVSMVTASKKSNQPAE